MKTPDALSFATTQSALTKTRAKLERAQAIATTGLQQTKGSDDTRWYETQLRTTSAAKLNERAQRGLGAATSRLEASEGALAGVLDAVASMREAAMQGANDTYSAADRRSLAAEIRALKATVIDAANTRGPDGYVFGGFLTGTPPFDATGTFVGDANVVQVENGIGGTTAAGIDARAVFAPAGGVDLLALFDTIATALDANNGAGVRAELGNIETAFSQVTSGRAEIGDQLNAVSRFSAWISEADERLTNERARSVEADPISAYSDLAEATTALEAALKISSQSMRLSLVDFL